MPRFILQLGFLAITLFSALASANNQLLIKDENPDHIRLEKFLYQWVGEEIDFEKLKDNIYFFSNWQPTENETFNFLTTQKPIHLMFSIKNTSTKVQELVLVHPNTSLDKIRLQYLFADGSTQELAAGNTLPFHNRPIPHRYFIFPLTINAEESVTVLIEVEGRMDNFSRVFFVSDRATFFERTDSSLFILSAYFCILLFLALYSMLLYLAVREQSYIWFTLLIITLLFRTLTMNNVLFEFVWPTIPLLQNTAVVTSTLLSTFLTGLFALTFLSIQKHSRRLSSILQLLISLHLPALIFLALSEWSLMYAGWWVMIFAFPYSIFIWCSAFWLYRKNNENAGVFLLAYSILLITGIIAAGNQFLDFNLPSLSHIEDIGQLLEIFILTFALTMSIGTAREKAHIAFAKDKAKSDFLAKMSHEIRTPINGVLGMAQLLAETPLSRKQQHYTDVINHCSKTLLNVINDILEYSKIEAGKVEFEHAAFNLDELLLNNNSLFWPQIHNKQIVFKYWIDPNIPFCLYGDPTRIQQIFNNLFSNAIKFTDSGTIKFNVNLLRIENNVAKILFSLNDTGIGMSDEEMERIFTPFSQASSSTNRFYGGSGLGLNITQQLVTLLNGDIFVKSKLKEGTEFSLTIPFTIDPTGERRRKKDLNFFANKRAFVLSNNMTNQELLISALRNWKIETSCFTDFNTALPNITLQDNDKFDIYCVDAALLKQLHHSQKSHLEHFARKLLVFDCTFNESTDFMLDLERSRILLAPFSIQEIQNNISAILGLEVKEKTLESATETSTFKPRKELKILVAEDDATNRLVIRAILKKLHIEHDIVSNGLLAKERYQKSPTDFDIILMDCEMPELNGYQATSAIREFESNNSLKPIPILALTAHVLPEYEKRCYESGMNLVIAKPINIIELSKAFDKYSRITD